MGFWWGFAVLYSLFGLAVATVDIYSDLDRRPSVVRFAVIVVVWPLILLGFWRP